MMILPCENQPTAMQEVSYSITTNDEGSDIDILADHSVMDVADAASLEVPSQETLSAGSELNVSNEGSNSNGQVDQSQSISTDLHVNHKETQTVCVRN